jgi:arylsulfatase A-like enzyme
MFQRGVSRWESRVAAVQATPTGTINVTANAPRHPAALPLRAASLRWEVAIALPVLARTGRRIHVARRRALARGGGVRHTASVMRWRWAAFLSAMVACSPLACQRPAPSGGPIVLVVVDTLRADHLPCYGYARSTAPHMCAVGADGVRFARAYAVRTRTTPSIASMLTGLYPYRHGVTELLVELPADVATAAQTLQGAGWSTGAFVSSFVMIGALSGLDRGFTVYDDEVQAREAFRENYQRDAVQTVDRALAWLRAAGPHSFLFLHLIEPHGPYTPPEPYLSRFALPADARMPERVPEYQRIPGVRGVAGYLGRYDGEVATADDQIGRVVAALRAWGWYDRATLILTADHGESMGEEGRWFEHGQSVGGAEAHVPLLVRFPGRAALPPGTVIEVPVSGVDVYPTILAAAGLDPRRAGLAGVDLAATAAGQPRPDPPPFTEAGRGKEAIGAAHGAACTPRWRLQTASAVELAPLAPSDVDPACAARAAAAVAPLLADRADFRPAQTPRVHVVMRDPANRTRFLRERAASRVPIDPAGHQALRQLGYVE